MDLFVDVGGKQQFVVLDVPCAQGQYRMAVRDRLFVDLDLAGECPFRQVVGRDQLLQLHFGLSFGGRIVLQLDLNSLCLDRKAEAE